MWFHGYCMWVFFSRVLTRNAMQSPPPFTYRSSFRTSTPRSGTLTHMHRVESHTMNFNGKEQTITSYVEEMNNSRSPEPVPEVPQVLYSLTTPSWMGSFM